MIRLKSNPNQNISNTFAVFNSKETCLNSCTGNGLCVINYDVNNILDIDNITFKHGLSNDVVSQNFGAVGTKKDLRILLTNILFQNAYVIEYKNDIEVTDDKIIFKGEAIIFSVGGLPSTCTQNGELNSQLGFYKNHAEAEAAGVPLFGEYIAADQNDLSVPYGTHVSRVE